MRLNHTVEGMFVGIAILAVVVAAVKLSILLDKRIKEKKVFEGAAFWLTSLLLCLIFAVIGISYGVINNLL